jgi:phosphatidylglycerol---prolipoprotein diacylglyceryl transferase
MRPILFDTGIDLPLLGPLNFPAYFTMLTLSFLLAVWMTSREAPRLGLNKDTIIDMNLWIVVWAILGARVLHVFADGHFMDYVHLCTNPVLVKAVDAKVTLCQSSAQCGYDYVCNLATRTCHPPRDCFAAVKVWRGGLAYYGGFVFASTFGLWYARKHKLGMWKVADLTAPWIAFGLSLTRIGCFLNGCCFGKVTHGRMGVHFPFNSAVFEHQRELNLITPYQNPLPVHPTQIYLAALNLLTFAALYYLIRPRKRFDGQLFAWLLICKGVFRSIVEIWRDDDRGVFLGGYLSTSQLISLPLIALGMYLLWKLPRQPNHMAATA